MIDRLGDLGDLFRQFREGLSISQEDLAERCGPTVNRSHIAHLEQGRRVPGPDVLKLIARVLGIPESTCTPFARAESHQRYEFEAALGELVGGPVALRSMDTESIYACESLIGLLFSRSHTLAQSFDTLNSILVFYAIPRMTRPFFNRYFRDAAFQSLDSFRRCVQSFQKESIRLFSTFGEGYDRLNSTDDLAHLLKPLDARPLDTFAERTVWEDSNRVVPLPEENLEFLGYISVAKYRKQRQKREALAKYLRELAADIRSRGAIALDEMKPKRKRRLDSLLKELDSTLSHTPLSALFAPNPAEIEAEASRILRNEEDEARGLVRGASSRDSERRLGRLRAAG